MFDKLIGYVDLMNSVLWDYILLIGLIGVGIYMTVRLRFPQFTRLIPAMKKMILDIKNKVEVEEGAMTPFQSLSTAIAAQVGTGNIVGVATAIAAGGPGAAFWMLLSAFFGMATIFSEAVLAQKYREVRDGELVGGPAYYIKNGMKSKGLSIVFAVFCIIALGIVGIMVQSNSVVSSINGAFGINRNIVIIGLLLVVGLILSGGMERIAGFTEKVVPLMAFAYIFGSFLIIGLNYQKLGPALQLIIKGAFRPESIGGGVLGIGVQQAVRFGLSRGLFSNEAGMGSTPHSHAVAQTNHPAEQGFTAMIGVFISTFCICLCTVLVNMTSGAYDSGISASQMTKLAPLMTQNGFAAGFGKFGGAFLSLALTFFSLTTIVGWYFFAESNIKLLVKKNKFVVDSYKYVVLAFMVVGVFIEPENVWKLADLFMGLMALPNIVAIMFLSKESVAILDDFDAKKVKEEKTEWKVSYKESKQGI